MRISDLEVHTVRKDIKNIHLAVYPPNGKVRVAAPFGTSDDAIRALVASKLNWIKKQKARFEIQERQTKREYVSGETHYLMGNKYLLHVIASEGQARVEVRAKKYIDLYIKPGASVARKEKVMEDFYRTELKKQVPLVVDKWQKITGLKVNEFRIKKMKTKWGTCNQKSRRIWINLELAKKPPHCLDYIVLHEMTHLVEKKHTKKFRELLDSAMPQWLQIKEELNRVMLGYTNWK